MTTLAATLAVGLGAAPFAHAADSPVRGNPLDSVPQAPAPQAPQKPVAVAPTPQSDATQAILARHVVPKHFNVTGVSTLDFGLISPILEPLADRDVTVADLVQAADQITAVYRDNGYALSFALIQNQDFKDGVVTVTVVEGYVGNTRIVGDAGPAAGRITEYAHRIEAERPLRRATLERYLNLIAGVAGVKVTPELTLPKRADGSTELVLNAAYKAVKFDGGISNLGTGTHAIVSATTNSLTPLGEQVRVTAAFPRGSDHLEYYAANAKVPVGSDGMNVQLDAFSYQAQPRNDSLAAQSIERTVRNQRVGASVNYPFILSNQQSLIGTAGIYASRNRDVYRSQITGNTAQLSNDVRVMRAELSYADASLLQSRQVTAGIYKGIDGLGANQNAVGSTATYNLGFTRFLLSGAQNLVLPARFGLNLAGLAQYSSSSLPISEQVTFGGQRFGRGYPAGELGGDKGYGLSIELNRIFATGFTYLQTVQPYVAYDYARATLNNKNFVLLNDKLASAALGLRISDQRHYAFDVNVAKPVGDRPVNSSNRPLRVNANYSFQFE